MLTDSVIQRFSEIYPFHQQTDAKLLKQLVQISSYRQLEAGLTVCHDGASCDMLAFILKVRVRVFKTSESGREITLYHLSPGQSCILTASCILTDSRFPAQAQCDTQVDAVLIPAKQVKDWSAEWPTWRQYIFSLYADRLADIISTLVEVTFGRVDERLANKLLTLAGSADQVSTTHQQLACELGTSREVVSRLLKEFETAGLLRLQRGSIRLLNKPALAKGILLNQT
ncbi:MAG: Crp/Fnr family transcriptional regulator [gamma proteobacterium symbiont of Bathyaustriella thionipta]|nr:Crp/Fnr family transcriptional regulator [gamma proteobacterium symbiont of Bathyaustriella thionipta]